MSWCPVGGYVMPTGTRITCGGAACVAQVEADPIYQAEWRDLAKAVAMADKVATHAAEGRVGKQEDDDNVCALCREPIDPNGNPRLRTCCFKRMCPSCDVSPTCRACGGEPPETNADGLREVACGVASGNCVAIRLLAQFYQDGDCGLARDEVLGLKLMHRAAELGNGLAMLNLGCAYYFGRGVDKDHAATVRYYRAAADKGVVKAILNLSLCYREGEGVDQDVAEADRLEELAQSAGYWSYKPGCIPGGF